MAATSLDMQFSMIDTCRLIIMSIVVMKSVTSWILPLVAYSLFVLSLRFDVFVTFWLFLKMLLMAILFFLDMETFNAYVCETH